MIIGWLNSRQASEIGATLADEFAPIATAAASASTKRATQGEPGAIEKLLHRADRDVRPLQLNFYQKAKFANAFKWRLMENGIARELADDVTHALVLHLSEKTGAAPDPVPPSAPAKSPDRPNPQQLFHRGNKCHAQGAYAEAVALYEAVLEIDPSQAETLNNLGSALSHLGRYDEAERCFREALAIKPDFPDPYINLGKLQRQKSYLVEAEALLRQALRLRPKDPDARIELGLTLLFLGRLRDARACFAKVLKTSPRNVHALYGMGQIALVEGKFDEAESAYRRILEINPKMTNALAALATTRKMTPADGEWLKSAEQSAEDLAARAIHPFEEANLRFSIGKYCDDVNDFARAFENFKRGNQLLKAAAEDYDRKERSRRVDELIRVYSPGTMASIGAAGSPSAKPVFVVGMPRSGTSLTEQIIASHPAAYGAGELDFWGALIAKGEGLTGSIVDEAARPKVAEEYLRILEGFSRTAARVVDKAPVNSDFLGQIYSVFPNAHVIYMQRDPIDTCLSCYFQQFLMGINFAFDLSDLAHYYREHQRLIAHWRTVLPPGFMLEVPYEELVSDPEAWSRKMLDFIGLDWDPQCLQFHTNKRQVTTASAWQVRQKIYKSSMARWRNYEKFIGPLKALGK